MQTLVFFFFICDKLNSCFLFPQNSTRQSWKKNSIFLNPLGSFLGNGKTFVLLLYPGYV